LKKPPQSDHWVATLSPSPHWGTGSWSPPRWVVPHRRRIEEMVVRDAYEAGGGTDEAGVDIDEAGGGGWEMT
jgi:hypothetical protein